MCLSIQKNPPPGSEGFINLGIEFKLTYIKTTQQASAEKPDLCHHLETATY
jgi:hypothetical protein